MSGYFHGRDAELERLRALTVEPVAVIYGLPGIGKTELAFQAVNQLLAGPGWRGAPVLRVIVDAEKARVIHGYVLARLTGHTSEHALDQLVELLARERHIVTLDDAHHAPAEMAALVDALGRRSLASRVLVTARSELPLETTPVVVRLGPLGLADARSLAQHLADRLGVKAANLDALVERSAGSPLVLRHLIAGGRTAAGIDPVHATVASLDSEALRSLIQLAAVSACSQSRLAAATLVPDERVLELLRDQCLVDCGPERVVVHGLIRDMVMLEADAGLVRDSRRAVAGALWERFELHHQPLLAVEAICLTATLGDVDQALSRLLAASRTIASAGLDLLLVPILETFTAGGCVEASLLLARTYLRMARIEDAAALLDRLTDRADDPRVLLLRATIAEHVCDLPAAVEAFAAAIERTPAGRFRCLLRMRLAVVEGLRGREAAAQELLRAVEIECPQLGDVDAARLWWCRGTLHALREDWAQVEAAVLAGRAAARRGGVRDIEYVLVLLELQAAAELGKVTRVGQLAEEVTRALASQPVRERITDLYLGIAHLSAGELDAASEVLRRAFGELARRSDTLLSTLAGYYLGRTLLCRGDARAAVGVLTEVVQRAAACGLAPLTAIGEVQLARALLAAGDTGEAVKVATPWIGAGAPPIAAQAEAVLAAAAAFGGDLARARRHLAAAFTTAGGREPLRTDLLLDEGEIEMLGGDPERVRAAASAVLQDEQRRARPHARGRALICAAVADLATGDVAGALEALAGAEECAATHGMTQLRDRVTMIRTATSLGRSATLDHLPAAQRPGYLGLLRLLGTRPDSMLVVGRAARTYMDPARLAEVARAHDIVVDASSGTVFGHADQRIEGRGTASAILVALAESPEPVPPERLYQLVWGGTEYHPLRHRNTLYIALNRTRKLLRDVGEEREVIHRDASGWSIAPDIDLVIARRDPRVASSISSRGELVNVKTK